MNSSFGNGDEIGVWGANNTLVGSASVENGKSAITIWGKNQLSPDLPGGAGPGDELYLTRWSAVERKEYRLPITSLSKLDGTILNDAILSFEQNSILIAEVELLQELPQNFTLSQNYPNPFNPVTTIQYELPMDGMVKIEVYNTIGQKVVTLVDGEHIAGVHKVIFDAGHLASGTYFYRFTASGYNEIKKMVLVK
jgi:hypothetical protein